MRHCHVIKLKHNSRSLFFNPGSAGSTLVALNGAFGLRQRFTNVSKVPRLETGRKTLDDYISCLLLNGSKNVKLRR